MSLLASIDLGSNTIRLLIGKVKDNKITNVFYEREITRLGNRVNQTGKLQDQNIEASLAVLKKFSSIILRHGVEYIKAVATSALREAYNSDIFIQKVFAETGISIEVISSKKEAELTLKGILLSLPESSPITHHPLFIVDIGGGSTEWILCRDKHPVDMGSIPIGVIKLAGSFIKTDPVSETDITELNKEIRLNLKGLKMRIGNYIDKQTCFIGSAGTFATIASIDLGLETYSREKIHLHRLPLSKLQDMSKNLLALPLIERKKVKGLEPGRADLIIPGIQFTINTMEFFQFDELTISDYGLLDGLLLETLNEKNEKNISETSQP
jgi:exopolyphosphatase/guanosine-5'-triphosphate,3'-diphosphate pyrophosphatase